MRALTIPGKSTTTLPTRRINKRSFNVRAQDSNNNNSNTKQTKERQPWDVQRFVKTVLYFNPPPSPGEVLRSAIELPFKVLNIGGVGRTGTNTSSSSNNNLITTVPLRVTTPTPTTTTMPFESNTPPGVVLVPDATSDVGKSIVARLLQQGRQVRAMVPDASSGQAALSSLVAAPGGRLEVVPDASASVSAASGVGQVIWPINSSSNSNKTSLQTLLASLIASGALPKSSGQAIYTPDGLSPAKEWGSVDDVVMGGVSSSGFEVRQGAAEDGVSPAGVFAGNVTTANNGGFASTRTRNLSPPLNLAAYDGVELKVRGDGQRYKCVIKIDASWDGVGYTASFDTTAAPAAAMGSGAADKAWQTIKIPFSSLVPVFRAKTQYDAAPFDPSKVTSIQLMLSKFEYDGRLNPTFREGKFELPVEKIQAYVEDKEIPRVILVKSDDGGVESGVGEVEEVVKASGVLYRVVSVSDFLN